MRKLILFLALAPVAALASSGITATCNIADGATVGGEVAFSIEATSDALISGVEYYVNGEIRGSDDSTPYEFKLDTIREAEGPIKVKFHIGATNGDQKDIMLNLVIDNGLGKGAEHWVTEAENAAVNSKWDDAIRYARVALKAKPKYNPARLVLARSYFGRGTLDLAQKYAEDVLIDDPANLMARDLSSAISLQKAFVAGSGTRDRNAALQALKSALVSAAQSRIQVFETQLNNLGPTTDANRLQVASIALRAGRYSVAIDALKEVYLRESDNPALVNRLMYAQIRAGKFQDAIGTATQYIRRGTPDGEGYGLLAILFDRAGDAGNAAEYERQMVLNDASALGVRLTQAYLATIRNNVEGLRRLSQQLDSTVGENAFVSYYSQIARYRAGDYSGSKTSFERAALADPSIPDLYIQQGNQALEIALQPQTEKQNVGYYQDVTRAYYEAALAAKPESFQAFTGLALVDLMQGKTDAAIKNAKLAISAGSEYAPGYYVASLAFATVDQNLTRTEQSVQNQIALARNNRLNEEVDKLTKQLATVRSMIDSNRRERDAAVAGYQRNDAKNLRGLGIPDLARAFGYFARFGRLPLIQLKPLQ